MTMPKLSRFRPISPRYAVWALVCFCLCALVPRAFAQSSTGNTANSRKPQSTKKVKIETAVIASVFPLTQPVYPPIAKAAGISGTVVLEATISKTGHIEDLRVVSGPPILQQAALDAVNSWRFRPYLLNGVPMKEKASVNVVFSLGENGAASATATAGASRPTETAP